MRNEVFDYKTDETFVERNADFSMKLTDRGKPMLALDKRTWWSKSAFEEVAK